MILNLHSFVEYGFVVALFTKLNEEITKFNEETPSPSPSPQHHQAAPDSKSVWRCLYPVYSACCVVLPLSCLQRLLMYIDCCVALPLSCSQRLLCGFAPIMFAALAAWVWC